MILISFIGDGHWHTSLVRLWLNEYSIISKLLFKAFGS
jgi:hypothetical protein